MSKIIGIIAVVAVVAIVFYLWRIRPGKDKAPENPFRIVGMWEPAFTPERWTKYSPQGISIMYRSRESAHHHGDIAEAADRAFNRLMNDIPAEYAKYRSTRDYFILICDETYPTEQGAPALKVTPVPGNLVGSIYDKGGFLLAAGLTAGVLGDKSISPPQCVIPNIESLQHINYIENAIKHEFEHRVAEQDPEYHAYRVLTEQHPFYPKSY